MTLTSGASDAVDVAAEEPRLAARKMLGCL
jgi:hypothetical protein